MNKPSSVNFFDSKDQTGFHTIILGVSGRGKSAFIQQEADRLGVSYEEVWDKSVSINLNAQQESEQINQRHQKRHEAMLTAYWENTPESDDDYQCLYWELKTILEVEEPTRQQVEAFLRMLPADLFYRSLEWGFSDSVLRDDLAEFVENSASQILETVRKIP